MQKELELVREFHKKFRAPNADKPSTISEDRANNRYRLMKEEVDEYLAGNQKGDLMNVAKEIADILYAVYGTVLEHGLQDKMEEIFEEVHKSNMSKDYHEYKMIKGASYFKADLTKFFH